MAGLNERKAPGKLVPARPPNRLAQLQSVSHAIISTSQKHRSKTSKLTRFGSLHFRDNWGWPCTAVRMWLICSTESYITKKRSFCYTVKIQNNIFCHIDSLAIFTAQIVQSHMYWGKICLYSLADQNVHRLKKKFSRKYHAKATWTVLLDWSFAMEALQ